METTQPASITAKAEIQDRLGRLDAALAMCGDAGPGQVYKALMEARAALDGVRLTTEAMHGLWDEAFAAGRASVLAEQAARAAAPALRLASARS